MFLLPLGGAKYITFIPQASGSPGSGFFHIGSQIALGVLVLRGSSQSVIILHSEHVTVIDSEVVSGGSIIHNQGDAFSLGNLKLMDYISYHHFLVIFPLSKYFVHHLLENK